ncbi:hypothetical protein GCM10010371_53270 [Streptomyces subrutilus]|uniref:Uncharacterized protein n=1 Tax=Streptomyces subrutilus TaxID=36818 RepID=A0A918R7I0_9ACTN|nr:hypothetical protein GCM10010371_53270 [Streptomyces subrutilus]
MPPAIAGPKPPFPRTGGGRVVERDQAAAGETRTRARVVGGTEGGVVRESRVSSTRRVTKVEDGPSCRTLRRGRTSRIGPSLGRFPSGAATTTWPRDLSAAADHRAPAPRAAARAVATGRSRRRGGVCRVESREYTAGPVVPRVAVEELSPGRVAE